MSSEGRDRWRRRSRRLRDAADSIYARHGRTLWVLHSVWAFLTGVVVLVLARERYGFVPWVVAFLGLTWVSTMFFSRLGARFSDSWGVRFGRGFVSYLTRVMYQETLFFLLPFYSYSVAVPSWGLLFIGVLAALAVLSCADLVFDGWIRRSRAFGLLFFGVVTFAALNFLFPAVVGMPLELATPAAAAVALGSALPLAYGRAELRQPRRRLEVLAAVALAALVLLLGRPALPPVPLRLSKLAFASGIEGARPLERLTGLVRPSDLPEGLAVFAEIFAPIPLPTEVVLRWYRDGELVRSSRELDVIAHGAGFRLWDRLSLAELGGARSLPPGIYTVRVTTGEGQTFGRARLEIAAGEGSDGTSLP